MQGERQRLGSARLERNVRPADRYSLSIPRAVWSKLLVDEAREIGALPAALCEQRVGTRQRGDAPVDGGDVRLDGIGTGQVNDRLNQRQGVARPVIHLARQQSLAFLGVLAIGDVDGHSADAHDVIGGIDARHGSSDAPAQLSVWTAYPKLGLE